MAPGPRLFEEQGDVVYGLILSLINAKVIVHFLGKGFMHMAKFVGNVPRHILAPVIACIAVAGTYSVGNSYFDVGVMPRFGLLGFFMDRYKFPTVPLIIALILGRSLEVSLLQSMVIFRGNPTRFMNSPVCVVSLALTVSVLWFGLRRLRPREVGGATMGSDTD